MCENEIAVQDMKEYPPVRVCGQNPRYPRRIKEMLKNAYDGERAAVAKYSRQAERIQDEFVVANLERIILDEKLHIKIFEDLYEKYC